MKAVAIFLFLAIKSILITIPCNENVPRLLLYNNSDANCRPLMSGDINPILGNSAAGVKHLIWLCLSAPKYLRAAFWAPRYFSYQLTCPIRS